MAMSLDDFLIDQPTESEVDKFLDDDSTFEAVDNLSIYSTVNDAVVLPLKEKKRFTTSEKLSPKKFWASLKSGSTLENIKTKK